MKRTEDVHFGLAGLHSREPIGCAVTVGTRNEATGAPDFRDRFFLMSPVSARKQFEKFSAPSRDFHPAFANWNRKAWDTKAEKPGQFATIRGNIVHASFEDAYSLNRSAHKLPNGAPNPPSQRPACEGNGIKASRYWGLDNSESEVYHEIACPNEACEFAIKGLCKPQSHLVFQLRWLESQPFPPMLAKFHSQGWHTASNLIGLFEYILGTARTRPWADKQDHISGLAAELGIEEPSLFGMPFLATIGQKTDSKHQRRYPVVSFTIDGNAVEWLLNQKRSREALSAPVAPVALIGARSADNNESRWDSAAEHVAIEATASPASPPIVEAEIIDPDPEPLPETSRPVRAVTVPSTTSALAVQPSPKLLSPAAARRIEQLANANRVAPDALSSYCADLCGSGNLTNCPASYETDLLSFASKGRK